MKATNNKRLIISIEVVLLISISIFSCGPKCKQCHSEMMGIKTPATELCGDQLKQAEKTQGMICE